MAYGLHITNDSGALLVSSDIHHFHFLGKPVYHSEISSETAYSGSKTFRYTITTAQTPLVFIKPNNTTQFCAILTHHNSGSSWTFDVLVSGTSSTHPTLYAFTRIDSSIGVPTGEDYGLLITNQSSEVTFDSRRKPLAILSAVECIPPAQPADGGQVPSGTVDPGWHDCNVANYKSNMGWDYSSEDSYNSYTISNPNSSSNLMFAAPSIAQSAWMRTGYHYHCDGCDDWKQANQHHTFNGKHGVFYRQAYSLQSTTVRAGWAIIEEYWWAHAEKTSWAPWHDECDGSGTFGLPFNNATVNRTSNTVLIADSTVYV